MLKFDNGYTVQVFKSNDSVIVQERDALNRTLSQCEYTREQFAQLVEYLAGQVPG